MTNRSRFDFERRILSVSKNYAHRDTPARERSMHRILKDIGATPPDALPDSDCAKLVTLIVSHWPQNGNAPTVAQLSAELVTLRADRSRRDALESEAAAALTQPAAPGASPAEPLALSPALKPRRGTNHSVYLRHDAFEWYTQQCPPHLRGKAELTRGIQAVFQSMRGYEQAVKAAAIPERFGAGFGTIGDFLERMQCPGSHQVSLENPTSPDPLDHVCGPQSACDAECMDRAHQADTNRRLQTAIALMREAASMLQRVREGICDTDVDQHCLADSIRGPLVDELTGAAYMLEELLPETLDSAANHVVEPELPAVPFDPLSD